MFPEGGRRIPFTIANYAYKDAFGRETVTWNRTFKFSNVLRKFDATMIYSQERRGIVDYLGNKQHLAVDLTIGAANNGGICIRSGAQRFYEGVVGFRFPAALTGVADVCEWFDDEERLFKITVEVTNPLLGPVFRYRGRFLAEFAAAGRDRIPLEALPVRKKCGSEAVRTRPVSTASNDSWNDHSNQCKLLPQCHPEMATGLFFLRHHN